MSTIYHTFYLSVMPTYCAAVGSAQFMSQCAAVSSAICGTICIALYAALLATKCKAECGTDYTTIDAAIWRSFHLAIYATFESAEHSSKRRSLDAALISAVDGSIRIAHLPTNFTTVCGTQCMS